MLPILFEENSTSWASFGIGVLSDAISCVVEENRNGAYELEMTYPITGKHFGDIQLRRIVAAKPNYTDPAQPFRIYQISKPLNGIVTINAQHISYDLSGYVDAPFVASGVQAAVAQMTNNLTVYPTNCPFALTSDMSNTTTMTLKHPQSVRALMGGVEGSLLDTFGGEWHFDGYTCNLLDHRGEDRGVLIRYGRNMTDLRQEENNAAVYTGVYPYYYNPDEDILVTLTEKVVNASGTFSFTRIYPLDLSSDFEETPTQAQLREKAQSYISNNNIGVPKVNLTIGFLQLDSLKERVDLCDTVSVRFDALGVSATAKCIRTKWDVLQERYIEAELGNARNSLAGTIIGISDQAQSALQKSMQIGSRVGPIAADIAKEIADTVTGNLGGYVILHDTNLDGEPDELLIMNTPDIDTATKIIRINNGGIAFSKTGYNGTYSTAWNIDGQLVADFIASGTIAANLVKIQGDSCFYWDAANINIVNPSNSQQIIRLGKYDGTNYGLGFSTDGGNTWQSGFDFNGITTIKSTSSSYCKMHIDGAGITFTDSNNVVYMYLGTGTVMSSSGSTMTGSYFRFGTFASGVVPGNLSLSAGSENSPTGYNSVALGSNNTASGGPSVALGSSNTASGASSFAAGFSNTASGVYSLAIGYGLSATAQAAAAIGGTDNSAAYARSVCLGGRGNTTARDGQVVMGLYANPTSAHMLVVGNGSSSSKRNIMALDNAGNLTIMGTLTQSSDERLKDIVGSTPDVSEIRAVRYRWNDKIPNHDDREHFGYIAQDVEKIAPDLVKIDDKGFKTLDYIGLLCAKIERLERMVAKLEAANGSQV